MSSKQKILDVFGKNLISFIEELQTKFPNEHDLTLLRIVFSTGEIPMDQVMEVFCERILPYESKINKKDESFFLEGTDLFEGLGSDKVEYLKNLWKSPSVDSEEKETIWEWMQAFLKMALKYKAAN